jgi:hypothetical protein
MTLARRVFNKLGDAMKGLRISSIIFALSAVICAMPGHAVCFYPHSTLSGYRIPLKYEVGASPVIIIGSVARIRYVQADPSDPNGITSYVYTIRRLQELKGSIPKYLTLRAENDSGGYRMSAGETNLLFLTQSKSGFTVDVCGNSTELRKGASVVSEVRRLLAQQGAQP